MLNHFRYSTAILGSRSNRLISKSEAKLKGLVHHLEMYQAGRMLKTSSLLGRNER